MKKLIILVGLIIATIAIVCTIVHYSGSSVDVTEAACFEFSANTGEIIKYKKFCGTKVNIPEKINNYEVKSIKSYAFSESNLEYVEIPRTIKTIGSGAFKDNAIKTLVLNEGITEIKPFAFSNNKIKKLDIPKTVTKIGISAFLNNELKGKDAFIYNRDENGNIDNTMLIGYAGKETEVSIPESVKFIYLNAFSDSKIEKINLPSALERIEYSAFASTALKEIIIPKSVVHIGENAFMNCESLEKIEIVGKKDLSDFNYLGNNWNNNVEVTFKN